MCISLISPLHPTFAFRSLAELEGPVMDVLLAAVVGELTTRSINFLIRNCLKPTAPDVEDRLRRILLRAEVIVDEAMGRQITNQAMLQQLDVLREAMHRGHYILDTFSYESRSKEEEEEEEARGQVLIRDASKVNPLQGLCSSSSSRNRNTRILEQMRKSVDHLGSLIRDVQELVVFLTGYPRIILHRQPYSMHLLLSNCMFCRQMETELVVDFLLLRARADHAPERRLDVLPIVGPRKVGKSTLVAHACRDERVRGRFSQILFLRDRGGSTGHDDLAKFREGCETEQQSLVRGSKSNRDGGRFLLVLELAGDLDEDSWGGFYSACTRHLPSGSKIIVTSQFDTIIKFGTTTTTQALRVKFLSHEAYWYFFKTLAFGSTDPKTRPRLARLAMEVAKISHPCFIAARMFASVLRDSSSDIRVWYKVLRFLREQRKENASKFGGLPFDLVNQRRPAYIGRMASPSEYAVFYDEQQCSSQDGVPEISAHDVMFGRVKAHGKFKVLGWRSHIPPYLSYVGTCEIQELKTTSLKRKRPCRCIEN